jgi:hypothetical protein
VEIRGSNPLGGTTREDGAMAGQPCVSCGEATGIVSVFYSDRGAIERTDGSASLLCTL